MPATAEPTIATGGRGELVLPQVIVDAGPQATARFLEFLAGRIANARTRAAYGRAVGQFLGWCEARGLGLRDVSPLHVAAYIRTQPGSAPGSAPTVKQHLVAIRMLGDWLVVSQVLPVNPAAAVRGPKHVVTKGATPVLSPAEARKLLESIDTGALAGLRDRALLSVMLYSFARVSAGAGDAAAGLLREREPWLVEAPREGREAAVHHRPAALDAYVEAAGLEEPKTALSQTIAPAGRRLTSRALDRRLVLAMIKRRAAAAGLPPSTCCHTFRATGITAYLSSGGTLERAQQIAGHASPKTTKLYDRDAYVEAAGLEEPKTALSQTIAPAGRRLTSRALDRRLVLAMIKRRAAAAGLPPSTCCHTFRATGITAYLSSGGTLERAQQIAGHASPKTTKLYDRTADTVTVDEIERIMILSVDIPWSPRPTTDRPPSSTCCHTFRASGDHGVLVEGAHPRSTRSASAGCPGPRSRRMTRSFGLDAASALMALKDASERFKNDDLNRDLARDCAIKSWQLCDHVFNALNATSRFTTLGDLQDYVRQTCPELAYLQDICTESKHGKISRYTPRITEASFHGGAFSRAFSRGFDIARLEIELPGGQTIFFNDVVDRAVDFWSKFFDDNKITP